MVFPCERIESIRDAAAIYLWIGMTHCLETAPHWDSGECDGIPWIESAFRKDCRQNDIEQLTQNQSWSSTQLGVHLPGQDQRRSTGTASVVLSSNILEQPCQWTSYLHRMQRALVCPWPASGLHKESLSGVSGAVGFMTVVHKLRHRSPVVPSGQHGTPQRNPRKNRRSWSTQCQVNNVRRRRD